MNISIFSLEEQVDKLSQLVHTLRERCDKLSLSHVKRPHSAAPSPHHSRHSTSSNSLSQKSHSKSAKVLPFRIIWGTRRNCSSQVIHKAIFALIPKDDWSCVTVKGSSRQRSTRHMWWHTLIAPAEVMQHIDSTWHILKARSSWSLQPSLSSSQISAQHGAISTDTRESAKVACEVSTAPSVKLLHQLPTCLFNPLPCLPLFLPARVANRSPLSHCPRNCCIYCFIYSVLFSACLSPFRDYLYLHSGNLPWHSGDSWSCT